MLDTETGDVTFHWFDYIGGACAASAVNQPRRRTSRQTLRRFGKGVKEQSVLRRRSRKKA